MIRKLLFFLFFLILLLSVNIAQSSNVRSETFSSYFSVGSSLGFQNFPHYVLLSVTSGNLNSSFCTTQLTVGGGWFRFTANETVTLLITHTEGLNVKLAGDNGNELRPIINGTNYPIALNNHVEIQWDYAPNIWFPISFIFGIVGLVSMFGGSLLGVSLLKKGEYSDALRFSAIWVALGITLTIAWLFA